MALIREGLVLWYDGIKNVGMEEEHSTDTVIWYDLSDNESHGFIVNGTWQEDALIFEKGSTWVNCGQHNDSYVTLEITFEITSLTNDEHAIFANCQSGGILLALSSTYTEFGVNISGTYYYAKVDSAVELNRKIHLVGTYDGTAVKLYIDGVLVNENAVIGVIKSPTNSTVMAIGGNPEASKCDSPMLEGKVYAVRAYSRALTAEEVLVNYKYEKNDKFLAEKYLLRSEGIIYTTVGDTLTALEKTVLTATLFESYGTDEPPKWALISGLGNVEVLAWNPEALPILTARLTALPKPQSIITNEISLSDSSITGVELVLTDFEGNPLYACSFDGGSSWNAHNGTEWTVLSEADTGMSAEIMQAITTEQWAEKTSGIASFKMRFTLNTVEDKVTNIVVDYTN